jgi:glycine/D-amino acid oxidase-like deaminating enzyme
LAFKKNIVICGSGIAGVSAAYHLAVEHSLQDILLIDQLTPLSLTSDQSTECYRNWWPGPDNAMVSLMNRSLDIIDDLAFESGNIFNLNQRGYLYLTEDSDRILEIIAESRKISRYGAGSFRIQRSMQDIEEYQPFKPSHTNRKLWGADLITDCDFIQEAYPHLSPNVVAALHVRRAGWLSAQQLGMYLLQKAKSKGVQFLQERIEQIDVAGNRVVELILSDGTRILPGLFINAAGPYIKHICQMMNIDLPVFCELHHKVSFRDHLNVVPRDTPFLIWMDPQQLPWTNEERDEIVGDVELSWMLNELPSGIHTRPEGGSESQTILILWEYCSNIMEPVFPIPENPIYPDIVIRGLIRMLPGMKSYLERTPKPVIDGGYYTKTRENRPIIGPLPVERAYLIGALSGFGIMAACGAGDLLAAHVVGKKLPKYASNFSLDRYSDPDYQKKLENWGSSGQL